MNADEALAHAERRRDLRVLMTSTETEAVLAAEVRRLREMEQRATTEMGDAHPIARATARYILTGERR
jgi:hypothetical protein